MRLIGAAFFVLALYLLGQTIVLVASGARPAPSLVGIVWLAVTAVAMFLLAWGKRVTRHQLGNLVLTKEAGVTIVDALLAVAVLIGLLLNAGFGWWWADPVASLVIVGYGVREGWTAQQAAPAQIDPRSLRSSCCSRSASTPSPSSWGLASPAWRAGTGCGRL